MYGTVARARVKPENREALRELMQRQMGERQVEGYITSYGLFEDGSDIVWMFAVFEDKATYTRNADDPAQHANYEAFRALMEDEPEWHDGEIWSA
jgi:quinol monooxygenase YgiN